MSENFAAFGLDLMKTGFKEVGVGLICNNMTFMHSFLEIDFLSKTSLWGTHAHTHTHTTSY